mmetsp:Transcript_29386/g.52605  ORF Transcript_29386/g.52605 Transcript_29386/m.52605 type:complete len:88 (+) Transcript_29386:716-979(+)
MKNLEEEGTTPAVQAARPNDVLEAQGSGTIATQTVDTEADLDQTIDTEDVQARAATREDQGTVTTTNVHRTEYRVTATAATQTVTKR